MKRDASRSLTFLLFGSVLSPRKKPIFDLEKQTDDFLKRTPFEGRYVWNAESKTAIIPVETNETLIITRGGGQQFNYYFDLITEEDETPITDHYYWIRKIFRMTEQVPDFDHETLWKAVLDLSNPNSMSAQQHSWYFDLAPFCSSELFIEKMENATSVRLGYHYRSALSLN